VSLWEFVWWATAFAFVAMLVATPPGPGGPP
jgi:hypothetical protein